jgi:hypothetical protein
LILFFQGRVARDVVFAIYPSPTYLARAERPSDLRVEFKGQRITGSDVIAVQIGIWNQGHLSVRPENVLEPLELVLTPSANILQASVVKPSRDAAGFTVSDDAEVLRRGRVPIRFKILEIGDGGTIQLIYAGSRATRIELSGIIEGQGAGRNISPESTEKDASPVERYHTYLRGKLFLAIAAGIGTVFPLE